MNYLFKIVATSSFFVIASLSNEATAGNKCIDEVCAAFLNGEIASLRKEIQELKGQRASSKRHVRKKSVAYKTSKKANRAAGGGKVCWWVQAKNAEGASTVVVYKGSYHSRGGIIATFGASGWKAHGSGFVKKICVPAASIAQLSSISMCNANGHNDFGRGDINTVLTLRSVGLNDVAKMYSSGGY
jgi:hypothetical protein